MLTAGRMLGPWFIYYFSITLQADINTAWLSQEASSLHDTLILHCLHLVTLCLIHMCQASTERKFLSTFPSCLTYFLLCNWMIMKSQAFNSESYIPQWVDFLLCVLCYSAGRGERKYFENCLEWSRRDLNTLYAIVTISVCVFFWVRNSGLLGRRNHCKPLLWKEMGDIVLHLLH